MVKPHHTDLPADRIVKVAKEAIDNQGGPLHACVYYKFTCPNCGVRCTFDNPNSISDVGHCDKCKRTSHITHYGFSTLHSGEAKTVFPKMSEVPKAYDPEEYVRVNGRAIRRGMAIAYTPDTKLFLLMNGKHKVVIEFKSLAELDKRLNEFEIDEQTAEAN